RRARGGIPFLDCAAGRRAPSRAAAPGRDRLRFRRPSPFGRLRSEVRSMSTNTAEPEYRLLYGQTWQDYERALAERDRLGRRYRITYDRGVLEIMPNSAAHERWKKLIACLLEAYCVTAGIPFAGLGQWTCRREDLDRGVDPDECYYVGNEPLVRGRTDLDL